MGHGDCTFNGNTAHPPGAVRFAFDTEFLFTDRRFEDGAISLHRFRGRQRIEHDHHLVQ